MIVIFDDTFVDRYKYQDISYLQEDKYIGRCNIYSVIKTTELSSLVKKMEDCKLFCYHRTLQFYDNKGNALANKENGTIRENFLKKVTLLDVSRIEFSWGIETNYDIRQIDKNLFYTNLKQFLDYYLKKDIIEEKILFWGADFKEIERLSVIQDLMSQIRKTDLSNYEKNPSIQKGLFVLYQQQDIREIIEKWRNNNYSERDIIREINDKI